MPTVISAPSSSPVVDASVKDLENFLAVAADPNRAREILNELRWQRDEAEKTVAQADAVRAEHAAREAHLKEHEDDLVRRERELRDEKVKIIALKADADSRWAKIEEFRQNFSGIEGATLTERESDLKRREKKLADEKISVIALRADADTRLAKLEEIRRTLDLVNKQSELKRI